VIARRAPAACRRWMVRSSRLVGRDPALFGLTGVAAALFGVYAVVRHQRLLSGPDLAVFDQAVWNYSHFRIGPSTVFVVLPSLLGQHFHPLVAVLRRCTGSGRIRSCCWGRKPFSLLLLRFRSSTSRSRAWGARGATRSQRHIWLSGAFTLAWCSTFMRSRSRQY
jgi:hypothetical protein